MRAILLASLLLAGCGGSARPEAPPVVEATYTGDTACASCHEDQYTSFQTHGMANSFYRMHPERVIEDFDADPIHHEDSDLYYRPYREGGRFFQEEYRLDENGNRTHRLVREMTHVVGSAQAARTYLYHENGRYYELPLTWYAQQGIWDLSPGYLEYNQRFDRKLSARCMACHTNAPPRAEGMQDVFVEAPQAISCERCHGPGSEHVSARRAVPEPPDDSDPTIVNPARLSMDRRLDVCQQCHLNGTVVMYPDAEDPYGFRPGEALGQNQILYAAAHQSGLEVVSHADRMKQSACYLETIHTPNPMECTTCHDPHRGFRDSGVEYFNATCRSCHGGVAEKVAAEVRPMHSAGADCASCHMAKREADNAPHSSFTDHLIAKVPAPEAPDTDSGPLMLERVGGEASEGELALAYLTQGLTMGDADLMGRGLALAESNRSWFEQPDNGRAALTLGKVLLASGRPADALEPMQRALATDTTDAERLHGIARALEVTGDNETALSFYKRALTHAPRAANIRSDYANLLLRVDRLAEAEEEYRRAIAEEPSSAAAYNGLAATLTRAERLGEAIAAAEEAVRLDPDYVDALTNLGTLKVRVGETDEGLELLRRGVARGLQERNLAPTFNLGLVALELGNADEAITMFSHLVRSNLENPDLRVFLARAFLLKSDSVSALAQVNQAVKYVPDHAAALQLKQVLESGN